jgi:hypothetical protein
MKARQFLLISAMLATCTNVLLASPHREKALWIEVKEHGECKTTIAVTEPIARALLESEQLACCLGKSSEECTITREMLRALLDGDQETTEIQNEDGSEVKLYMASLKVPGYGEENGKLILETYKEGARTLRISLPEIAIEAFNGKECEEECIQVNVGWKGLLPFLAKQGGAIYVDSQEDETEVWVYVD